MLVIGLGTNQGDRLQNLRDCYRLLLQEKNITVKAVSPIYFSHAQMPAGAPAGWDRPYLNMALQCDSDLNTLDTLKVFKKIEGCMGRQAQYQTWSPRIMDIDILYWPNRLHHGVNIPHPLLFERPFALWSLEDLICEKEMAALHDPKTKRSALDISRSWGSRFDKQAPFKTHQIQHRIDIPQMMGILNITPNSFSDGGLYLDKKNALEKMVGLFEAGAEIIDLGAESTRPNNQDVLSPEVEWKRLLPILKQCESYWQHQVLRPKISVDTRSVLVAEKALQFNIDFINDVSGLTCPEMINVVKDAQVKLIFMHHLSIPPTQENRLPINKSPVPIIAGWALNRINVLSDQGISSERLIFDPGIGFGKTPKQNLEIIKNICSFSPLNLPILVGHSRKSFLQQFTSRQPAERGIESAVISQYLSHCNVDYLRVHDVYETMQLFKVTRALISPCHPQQ
jgi:2-amino-4-hydroxy-6-hydroxymethyldihydropteridine diphosphokinase/dihydropteroate synthase